MRQLLLRIAPVLHLTRLTTAFAAVGNIWFVILWTDAHPPFEKAADSTSNPLWVMLGGGAVVGVCLYAFAAALNDTLDIRRDRVLHPLRPLASGRLNIDAAVGLVVVSLLGAILGATAIGTSAVLMTLLTAGACLVYHGMAKFFPAVGLVALSLIYGAHMLIGNVELVFVWPVWLVMTHAMLVGATTHRLEERRPALSTASVVSATLGWTFWSAVLLYVGTRHGRGVWPDYVSPWSAVGPGVLAALFVVVARRKAARAVSARQAADKITRYGALWLTLYGVAWLVGQGKWTSAAILGGLAAVGFLGMTVLREAYAMLEHPLAYRR